MSVLPRDHAARHRAPRRHYRIFPEAAAVLARDSDAEQVRLVGGPLHGQLHDLEDSAGLGRPASIGLPVVGDNAKAWYDLDPDTGEYRFSHMELALDDESL